MIINLGLDVGSTTVKLVALDENLNILYSTYRRHFSDVKLTVRQVITDAYKLFSKDYVTINVTGSGGLWVNQIFDIEFIQEVVAGTLAISKFIPKTDIAIELGGEDSKITYLRGSLEQRMNSICAGGTGAFIDQMATLLRTDSSGLNELAKNYKKIYPIASRCGVFAKTDIQALINQGASKEDIAVSVFQSVVNQTISNLACGRPIRGHIAFLGGPLHFLPMLRERFIETLNLKDDEIIIPENSEIFVAIGAALSGIDSEIITFKELYKKVNEERENIVSKENKLKPLFKDEEDLENFRKRHSIKRIKSRDFKSYEGNMYLGIDSGSTTSKLVLISEDNELLYSYYSSNKGDPLKIILDQLLYIYENKNPKSIIKSSGSTGYGEEFLKAAFNLDFGEVETIAHFKAAKFFEPDVDFVIDIGGQDMKSMKIENGIIESILLNEACSSGCGSFLETFARSVNMNAEEFSKEALKSKNPVDLGSRCTVFMNSNVKQAQKEGANLEDISAGLAFSVIRNAIQKVIKIRDPKELGKHIVVQGGTFLSDAVLRAFEIITGRNATRPSISGLMGAFGMALISKERAKEKSTIISFEDLKKFTYKTMDAKCGRCTNNCALRVNIFPNNKRYISGNRCERGSGLSIKSDVEIPNLYKYKYERLFNLKEFSDGRRGKVGIPRVLNMYENYPFWHDFFETLGFNVVLSDESTRKTYEEGIESITSETACYPAKISHGHIENLIKKGIKFIFYPGVFYEEKEFHNQNNNLNCPVVAGYSEVIKNNVENIKNENVKFLNPFISFADRKKLEKRMVDVFTNIPVNEIREAVRAGYKAQDLYRYDVELQGINALKYLKKNKKRGIVLAGRPYHIDPEINHGIPELITSLGLAVLSEDSIAGLTDTDGSLRVLDQWTYHARLYRAAKFVGKSENLEMVQLNSFGCGIDAITTDQVNEILKSYNKIHTVLKIDEVSNLGAIKIRIRSLLETVENRKLVKVNKKYKFEPVLFTQENKKNHTILMPQMAPIHFKLFASILKEEGFNLELLERVDSKVVNEGLKYVNNDACYPTTFVVGQFMDAVKSGKYDTDNLTLLISQTGGACRASNYVGLIRKALKDAGYGHVPVLALSFQGIENHPGIKLPKSHIIKLFRKLIITMQYGDLLSRLLHATRPYEMIKGSSNILLENWIEKIQKEKSFDINRFRANVSSMIRDFSRLEINDEVKPKVGIVGEILVKYLPAANNHLIDKLEEEGAEAVISDLTDFILYGFKNSQIKAKELSKSRFAGFLGNLGVKYIDIYRNIVREFLKDSRYPVPEKIKTIMSYANEYVSLSNQYGEGWLLTGEMVDLIEHGVKNIVCVQPFGCLPNHITGKGVIKAIRNNYSDVNIVPIDFDASASEVNQFNRIKLMLSMANKNLEKIEGKVIKQEKKKRKIKFK